MSGETSLKTSASKRAAMDAFLSDVERRAFVIARTSLANESDALDVVQEAMIRLVRKYAGRDAQQWRPLFYRILRNRIIDLQRKRTVRRRVMVQAPVAEGQTDPLEQAPAHPGEQPDRQAMADQALASLQAAVLLLPHRQQQAFLLRIAEGLDVAQTAVAMGCSEGSVKTHYSRAIHALRDQLGEHR
jgi:RNA polymerase sigma-70 factor (ECF subfamily)